MPSSHQPAQGLNGLRQQVLAERMEEISPVRFPTLTVDRGCGVRSGASSNHFAFRSNDTSLVSEPFRIWSHALKNCIVPGSPFFVR